MEIHIEDMPNIGRGAAFLGTGGGGDPHIGQLLCEQTLREFGGPTLISLEELARMFHHFRMRTVFE